MSNVTENLLVNRAKGNVSKQFIYKTRGNKTMIAKMPSKRKGRTITEQEETIRERFASASMYAQGAMASEELRKEYQKKANRNTTAANLAARDYLKSPKVKGIILDDYTGTTGSAIAVRAIDDFKVTRVKVSINSAAGILLEEGEAVQDAVNRAIWKYTTLQNNAAIAGTVITAIAFDLPGNKGTLQLSV